RQQEPCPQSRAGPSPGGWDFRTAPHSLDSPFLLLLQTGNAVQVTGWIDRRGDRQARSAPPPLLEHEPGNAGEQEDASCREKARRSGAQRPGRFASRANRGSQKDADDREQKNLAGTILGRPGLRPHQSHRRPTRGDEGAGPEGRVSEAFGAKSSTIRPPKRPEHGTAFRLLPVNVLILFEKWARSN